MSFTNRFDLPSSPYFLSHSVGCLTHKGKDRLLENYLQPWQQKGGDAWPQWLDLHDVFCGKLADYLNGSRQEFCGQTNLSSGLTKLLAALPRVSKRKNVVLMHEDAFPSMGFVVEALKTLGLELKLVSFTGNQDESSAWQQAISPNTLCAINTHVHSNTGWLSEICEWSQLCKVNKVFSIVDVAQSVGLVPIDLAQWSVDAVLGSSVKWLCGGPGAGFLWVNADVIDSLSPLDVGWFSHENPFEMVLQSFRYAADTKRFWGGTPNIAPYALALGGIETLHNIGQDTVWRHNRALLAVCLQHIPFDFALPKGMEKNGGTLCLQLPVANKNRILDHLTQQNMFFDARGTSIRLSFHIYNTLDDVEQLCETLNSSLAK